MTDLDDLGLPEGERMAAAFTQEMGRLASGLAAASREAASLERGFAGGLSRAMDGLVLDGGRLSDVLAGLGRSLLDTVYRAAMKPVTDQLGGLLAQGVSSIVPFAKGGVVSQATAFPLRGGLGVMGEAGPEAIMPLARGPDGKLGVRGAGGGGAQVTINVSTPDAASFSRSQSQIAAEMQRLLARGARNR